MKLIQVREGENWVIINEENKIAESTKLIREIFGNTNTKKEMDLIYAIISLVQPEDTRFTEYKISYKEIAKLFNPVNPRKSEVKKEVIEAVEHIINSSFQIKSVHKDSDETDKKYYHWVENAETRSKSGYVVFRLSEDVQQFYLQLKKGEYTVYLLKDLISLSTIFQANLFRWACSMSGYNNDVFISLEEATYIFNRNKSIEPYDLVRAIKRNILAINERTSLYLEMEPKKENGKIIGFNFKIKNNYNTSKEKDAM